MTKAVISIPPLSICIPTFNRERLLSECLHAVLPEAASLGIPVVVYDNASSDGTWAFLNRMHAAFSNLIVFRQERNVGFDLNHLSLINKVKTRYAWLLGDDDVIMPGALATVCELLRADPPPALVLLNAITTDNDMRPIGKQFQLTRDTVLDDPRQLLREYPDKLTFGMMVIDAFRFNQCDASRYVDTAHLYAGGVLDCLAEDFAARGHCRILITESAFVNLRQGVRPWTLGAGDISVRQIPQFYLRLPELFAREAEVIRQRVVGATRLVPAMIRMRAAGWLDATRAEELAPLFAGPHAWRLQMVASLPQPLAKLIASIFLIAPSMRRELKRLSFSMGWVR